MSAFACAVAPTFRPTRIEDVGFVLGAERAPHSRRFVQPWTEAEHRRALADPRVLHAVLIADSAVAGFLILEGLGSAEVELRRLVVGRPGLGFGRTALCWAEAQARLRGAKTLWLDVFEDNARALRLYESCGFRRTPTQASVSAGGRTLVVMEKRIDRPERRDPATGHENKRPSAEAEGRI